MLLAEFKRFIARGNVIDLAVGVIIGSAFNAIVQSLVKDILMPVFGLLAGQINLRDLSLELVSQGPGNNPVVLKYGLFIQAAVDFFILALCVFFMVKAFNKFMKKAEDPKDKSAPTPKDIELLSEIRDLLKERPSR